MNPSEKYSPSTHWEKPFVRRSENARTACATPSSGPVTETLTRPAASRSVRGTWMVVDVNFSNLRLRERGKKFRDSRVIVISIYIVEWENGVLIR